MTPLRWLLLGLLGAPVALAPVLRTTVAVGERDAAAPDGNAPKETRQDVPEDGEAPESIAVPSVFLKPAARGDTGLTLEHETRPPEGPDGGASGDRRIAPPAPAPLPARPQPPDAAGARRAVGAAADRRRVRGRAGRFGLPPPRSPGSV